MWHEVLFQVLSIINYVVLIIIAVPLLWQIIVVFAALLPKKKYPKSEVKGRIAFLIPAHNEENVIFDTVSDLVARLNYPRELYDVFVVADNCTDNTAELARQAGAIVLIHDDPNPEHHIAAYPLKFGIEHILNSKVPYDMVIHLDADNHVNADFAVYMNDAFQSGVDLARPFEGATNATQNFFTKACTLFYMIDSRYGGRAREKMHLAQHVNGAGAMMSTRMLAATGGYDSVTVSDDTEYYFNRLVQGYKGHFVEDAVVYEDMPSSLKDTYYRNKRIGSGGTKLIKSRVLKMTGKFFTTGDFSYMDIFLSYIFVFLSALVWWLPVFYIYDLIYTGLCAYEVIPVSMYAAQYYQSVLWGTVIVMGSILVGLFVFFGWLQALFLVITEYRKIGAKNRRSLATAVLLFPVFLILYSITVSFGAMSCRKKDKWESAGRNASGGSPQGSDLSGGDAQGADADGGNAQSGVGTE